MALSLVASLPTSVFAGTLQNIGDSTNQNVTATFTVQDSDLGEIIVSIPASVDLEFDSVSSSYKTDSTDKVYAYGYLANSKKLDISTSTSADFVNGTSHLSGAVTFGTAGKASWSSAELLAGQSNSENIKKETLDVAVTNITGAVMGQYNATLTFTVETVAA